MAKLTIELMTDENDSKEDIEHMIFEIAEVCGNHFIPFEKIEFNGKLVADSNRYYGLE